MAIGSPIIGEARSFQPLKSDTKARSIAKTLAYRIVAIALLATITYAFTGNLGETTVVTVVFNVAGAAAYYGLERAWDRVDWGREPVESARIPSMAILPVKREQQARDRLLD